MNIEIKWSNLAKFCPVDRNVVSKRFAGHFVGWQDDRLVVYEVDQAARMVMGSSHHTALAGFFSTPLPIGSSCPGRTYRRHRQQWNNVLIRSTGTPFGREGAHCSHPASFVLIGQGGIAKATA
jgi:hypothetical protein